MKGLKVPFRLSYTTNNIIPESADKFTRLNWGQFGMVLQIQTPSFPVTSLQHRRDLARLYNIKKKILYIYYDMIWNDMIWYYIIYYILYKIILC